MKYYLHRKSRSYSNELQANVCVFFYFYFFYFWWFQGAHGSNLFNRPVSLRAVSHRQQMFDNVLSISFSSAWNLHHTPQGKRPNSPYSSHLLFTHPSFWFCTFISRVDIGFNGQMNRAMLLKRHTLYSAWHNDGLIGVCVCHIYYSWMVYASHFCFLRKGFCAFCYILKQSLFVYLCRRA